MSTDDEAKRHLLHDESALMVSCAQVTIDAECAERIKYLIHRQHIDWDHLLLLARTQGVLLLLHNSLTRIAPGLVPARALTEMQHQCSAYVARNLFSLEALNDTMLLFSKHGIEAIPYKGTILSLAVYGNVALRPTGDLDFLVHSQAYSRTKELLLSQGYKIRMNLGWKCHLTKPVGTTTRALAYLEIDLHQSIVPSWYRFAFDFNELWGRCTTVELERTTVKNFSTEDLLTILCLDLAKDIAQAIPFHLRLGKVTDILEVLRRNPNISWPLVLDRARHIGALGPISLGLQVADSIYAISIPKVVRELIVRYSALLPIVNKARVVIFRADTQPPGHWRSISRRVDEIKHIVKLQEALKAKVIVVASVPMVLGRWCVRATFIPTDTERAIVSLPRSLDFVYYIIRPVRLTMKYFVNGLARLILNIIMRLVRQNS